MLYRIAANVFNYTRTGAEALVCFAPAAAALLTSSGRADPQGMVVLPCSPQKCAAESGVLQRQTETQQIFIEGVGESEIGA